MFFVDIMSSNDTIVTKELLELNPDLFAYPAQSMNIWLLISHHYLCLHVKHAAYLLTSVTDPLAMITCVILARLAHSVYLVPCYNGPADHTLPKLIHFSPSSYPQSISDRSADC